MHLDHINLYVSDLTRSMEFYKNLLLPNGLVVNREFENIAVGFGADDYAVLALVKIDEAIQPTHIAFRLDTRGKVDELYHTALSAGAGCNGKPGLRPHYHKHYYAAFVRDPDRHNLEFVCHTGA